MKNGEITPNIFLSKPSLDDIASILDINFNSDQIDSWIQALLVGLNGKVNVQDSLLSGNVTATNPDANVPNERSAVATVDWIGRQIGVKEIKIINSRNELPDVGASDIIYVIKNEEGIPELVWDNKTLSFKEHE